MKKNIRKKCDILGFSVLIGKQTCLINTYYNENEKRKQEA